MLLRNPIVDKNIYITVFYEIQMDTAWDYTQKHCNCSLVYSRENYNWPIVGIYTQSLRRVLGRAVGWMTHL